MVRMVYVACGVRVASDISSGLKDSIKQCSSNCFSIFYDYTAVHDILGLMFQWRFDNCGAISLLYFLLDRCAS